MCRCSELLQAAGLRVPEIFDWDEAQGFMLLSDVGTQTLIDILDEQQPQEAQAWYRHASDLLLPWQLSSRPDVLPAYDEALLRRELQLFPDWYIASIASTRWMTSKAPPWPRRLSASWPKTWPRPAYLSTATL